MKTPLILLAAGLGVLLLSAGCSSLIYYATSRTGSETPPQPRLALTRDDVEAKLGKPVAVTPLPDLYSRAWRFTTRRTLPEGR